MQNNVQRRLVELRNELQAQKAVTPLAYSTVMFPDRTPEAGWSGTINTTVSPSDDAYLARWLATFERADGVEMTPLVDFTCDYTAPSMADYIRSIGGTATGRDLAAEAEYWIEQGILSTTDTSVTFGVSLLMGLAFEMGSAAISLTVRAISPVPGTLKLEKIV